MSLRLNSQAKSETGDAGCSARIRLTGTSSSLLRAVDSEQSECPVKEALRLVARPSDPFPPAR